jgi:hypothetical protein
MEAKNLLTKSNDTSSDKTSHRYTGSFFAVSATIMSFNTMRKTMKRAAATIAERKIKVTLDEISGWSDSEGSSKSTICHRLNDFDDLPVKKRKKAGLGMTTNEVLQVENPANLEVSSNKEKFVMHSNKPDPSANAEAASDSESTVTELSSGSSFDGSSLAHAVVEYVDYEKERKERHAQARQQHSNQPMVLSGRLFYRISDPELSPIFSPIAAMKLLFPPTLKKQESAKAKARLHL